MQVPLDDIRLNASDNPRWNDDVDDVTEHVGDDIEDLKASFKSIVEYNGDCRALIQPITLVHDTTSVHKYRIGAGFRRYIAMRQLRDEGYEWAKTIEAEVPDEDAETSETGFHVKALIENVQRKDMPPIMEARAIQKLCVLEDKDQSEIAREIGKSKGWVSQRIGLLDLDPATQAAVEAGDISVTHARELGRIDDEDDRRQKLDDVISEGKNSKELKSEIDAHKSGEPTEQGEQDEPDSVPNQSDESNESTEPETQTNGTEVSLQPPGIDVIRNTYQTCQAYEQNDKQDATVETARSYYFHLGAMYMLARMNGDADTELPLRLAKEEEAVFSKDAHQIIGGLL